MSLVSSRLYPAACRDNSGSPGYCCMHLCLSHLGTTRLAAAATGAALDALALPDGDCGLGVGGCGTHALLDLAGHGQEGLLDVGGALCRRLEEGNAEAVCEFLGSVRCTGFLLHMDEMGDVPLPRCTRRPSCQPYRTCCRPAAC